jgi:hypothetical protein
MTTLDAGRELDALVAERVMGWTHVGPHPWGKPHGVPPEGRVYNERFGEASRPVGLVEVPAYSTDIAAAWQVVEKIRNTDEAPDQTYWNFTDCSGCGWRAEVLQVLTENDMPHLVAYGVGETLPEAICRAALAAVGAA